jgi:DNA-binding CsgD family transcriptional regulator
VARRIVDAAAVRDLIHMLTAPPPRQPSGAPIVLDRAVLGMLTRLVPADVAVFNDLAPWRRTQWAGSVSDDVPWYGGGEDAFYDAFYDAFWLSAPCSYPIRSGDLDSVITISDFCSLPEWRGSPMYGVLRTTVAFDRELLLPLPSPLGHSRRIRFLRLHGLDFDDTDRSLATLVRPHLLAHLHALDLASRDITPLTTRQHQLLTLLARGLTNAQIARLLGISSQTVRTHLHHIYGRLGVTSRGEAVALIRPPGAETPLAPK